MFWCERAQSIRNRVRVRGMLSCQRYAQPAKQQVQMRVLAEMRRAIVSLVDCSVPSAMPLMNCDLVEDGAYVASPYYKKHEAFLPSKQ